MKKYREELFGTSTEIVPNELYSTLDMLSDIGITIEEFDSMDIHNQAMTIAHYQLKNIVAIVRRHDELQKEKAEKLANPKKR